MSLIGEFSRIAPNRVFAAIVLGAAAGMSYALLIPLVLAALQEPPEGLHYREEQVSLLLGLEVSSPRLAITFFATCLLILVARVVSQTILTRVSMELTTSLRMRLYQRILDTPYEAIERIGSARLSLTLLEDVKRIVMGAQTLPDLMVGAVTVLGVLTLMLFVNTEVFVFVLQALVVAVITYQVPMLLVERRLRAARLVYDQLSRSIRGLIYGIKELKLSQSKQRSYLESVLGRQEEELQNSQYQATSIMSAVNAYGDMLGFIVIGILAFLFVNYHSLSPDELIVTIMSLLYLAGPIALITNSVPALLAARVSYKNVQRLFGDLPGSAQAAKLHNGCDAPNWNCVRLSDVTYQRDADAHRDGFVIGPINMTVRRGEVTFIAGGNGSGKSTLAKIITLLYRPTSGTVHYGDEITSEVSSNPYRHGISTIFTDYHLFDQVLDRPSPDRLAVVERHIARLGLDRQVAVGATGFSTVELSDGQRKRLALAIALLDDSQLYLFDEWAADQDAEFKHHFYTQVLPELRAQGKAVVVISHDDRYFSAADRIYHMEQGLIVRQEVRGDV